MGLGHHVELEREQVVDRLVSPKRLAGHLLEDGLHGGVRPGRSEEGSQIPEPVEAQLMELPQCLGDALGVLGGLRDGDPGQPGLDAVGKAPRRRRRSTFSREEVARVITRAGNEEEAEAEHQRDAGNLRDRGVVQAGSQARAQPVRCPSCRLSGRQQGATEQPGQDRVQIAIGHRIDEEEDLADRCIRSRRHDPPDGLLVAADERTAASPGEKRERDEPGPEPGVAPRGHRCDGLERRHPVCGHGPEQVAHRDRDHRARLVQRFELDAVTCATERGELGDGHGNEHGEPGSQPTEVRKRSRRVRTAHPDHRAGHRKRGDGRELRQDREREDKGRRVRVAPEQQQGTEGKGGREGGLQLEDHGDRFHVGRMDQEERPGRRRNRQGEPRRP